MSDNSNYVHFFGRKVHLQPLSCLAWADNDKMRATNESYALKTNIIVILEECSNFDLTATLKDQALQEYNCTQ